MRSSSFWAITGRFHPEPREAGQDCPGDGGAGDAGILLERLGAMVTKDRLLRSILVTGQVACAGSAADIFADERIRVA